MARGGCAWLVSNSTPQAVARASFQLPGYTVWNSDADFPETVTLAPGQTVTGDLAWYIDDAQPQPTTISIGFSGQAAAAVAANNRLDRQSAERASHVHDVFI